MKKPMEMITDQSWRRLYLTGGLSLMIMAVIYSIDLPLFYVAGGVAGPEEGLKTIAAQRFLFQAHGVLLLAFFLLIPGILAIYMALKDVNPSRMLTATAVGILASIQVAWIAPLVLSEAVLSDGYMAANSEAVQNAYVVATDMIRGVLSATYLLRFALLFIYMVLLGLVMRQSIFKKWHANLSAFGGFVGLLGILAALLIAGPVGTGLSSATQGQSAAILIVGAVGYVPIAILPPVWSFVIGYRLFGLGKLPTRQDA